MCCAGNIKIGRLLLTATHYEQARVAVKRRAQTRHYKSMKNFLTFAVAAPRAVAALTAAVALCLCGCISVSIGKRYTAGVWRGEARGYSGPVAVEVETDESSMLNIEIVETREDIWVGGEAMNELLDAVLAEDSTNVDVISGATYSSNAFLEAVDEALKKARKP